MKLHGFNLRVIKIVCIAVVVIFSYSVSRSQEDANWSKLKEELLSYPLQQSLDSQAFLNKYKDTVTRKTLDDLIKLTDSDVLVNDSARVSFILKFAQFLAHKFDEKRLEGICFSKLGEISFANGEYDPAVEYYAKGRELLIITQSPEAITLLMDFSNLQFTREEYDDAKSRAEEGLRLLRHFQSTDFLNNSPTLEANLQSILGEIAYKRGEYAESVTFLKSAIEVFGKRKLNTVELLSYSEALVQLGKTYRALGEYNQALAYFNEALQKGKELPDEAFHPNTLNSIAILYMEQRDYETAREYLSKSLKLYETRNIDFEKADVLLHLGVISVRLKKSQDAVKYLYESYKLYEKHNSREGLIVAGNVLGESYRLSGNFNEALNLYNRSLTLAEKQKNNLRLAETYWHIAELSLDKGNWQEAIKAGQKAMSFSHTQSNPNLFYLVNTAVGRAYLKQGDYLNGERYLKTAIQSIEDARGEVAGKEESLQLFFVDKVSAYRSLIDGLIAQKRFEEALIISERAKGRVLYDSFQSGKASGATDKANVTGTKDRANYFRTSIPSLSKDEIVSLGIDGQTIFLTYVIGVEKVYLFALTGNKQEPLQVFPFDIKIEELEGSVSEFSREVATHDLLFAAKAKTLYELLITPAKDLLKANQRVVIVPDGFLWNLPFQALMDAKDGKYLLEKYDVSYTPSLSAAVEIRKKEQRKKEERKMDEINLNSAKVLLAVGNPLQKIGTDDKSQSYTDLPEAEEEVLSLASVYGKDKSKILVKEKAVESQIKSMIQNYRILHFAAHGVLYKERPLTSALVLAKYDSASNSSTNDRQTNNYEEDGLLKGEEIIRFKLNADLVVLSACESAQGEITNGEGMVGLSWAFLYAGASNVVASQWKVDSVSTTKLMVDFHRELAKKSNGLVSKSSALRTSALKLKEREGYSHPFFWAGFIQIGSGN